MGPDGVAPPRADYTEAHSRRRRHDHLVAAIRCVVARRQRDPGGDCLPGCRRAAGGDRNERTRTHGKASDAGYRCLPRLPAGCRRGAAGPVGHHEPGVGPDEPRGSRRARSAVRAGVELAGTGLSDPVQRRRVPYTGNAARRASCRAYRNRSGPRSARGASRSCAAAGRGTRFRRRPARARSRDDGESVGRDGAGSVGSGSVRLAR